MTVWAHSGGPLHQDMLLRFCILKGLAPLLLFSGPITPLRWSPVDTPLLDEAAGFLCSYCSCFPPLSFPVPCSPPHPPPPLPPKRITSSGIVTSLPHIWVSPGTADAAKEAYSHCYGFSTWLAGKGLLPESSHNLV